MRIYINEEFWKFEAKVKRDLWLGKARGSQINIRHCVVFFMTPQKKSL